VLDTYTEEWFLNLVQQWQISDVFSPILHYHKHFNHLQLPMINIWTSVHFREKHQSGARHRCGKKLEFFNNTDLGHVPAYYSQQIRMSNVWMRFDSIFTYVLEDIQRRLHVRVGGIKYPVSDIISAISIHRFGNYQSYIHIQISLPWISVVTCVCEWVMCVCVCVCVRVWIPFFCAVY